MKCEKIIGLFFFSILIFCESAFAGTHGGSCAVVANNTVAAAWISIDDNGNATVKAAKGSMGSAPSTWTTTTISSGISDSQNSRPKIYTSTFGDVLVTWQYADANGYYHVAASMSPVGSSSWNSATISADGTNAGFVDESAAIDALGHVIVMWSCHCPISNTSSIQTATTTMGLTSTWSTPSVIGE